MEIRPRANGANGNLKRTVVIRCLFWPLSFPWEMVLEGFCCSCKSEESMLGAGRRPRNSSIYINIYIYLLRQI